MSPISLLFALVVLVLLAALAIYNGLVCKVNRVEQANGSIDVMLKKRWDLIPNLVAAVERYMEHKRSVLEKLDVLRRHAVARVGAWLAIVAVGSVCSLGAWAVLLTDNSSVSAESASLVFIVPFLLLLAAYLATSGPLGDYRIVFKRRFIQPLVVSVYPDARFEPRGGITKRAFVTAALFRVDASLFESEDLIEATWGSVRFRMADTHAWYRGFWGWRHTIFQGVVVVAELPTQLQGMTIVIPRWPGGNPSPDLETIELEESDFALAFRVFASDRAEARRVLSPAMMDRLVRLAEHLGRDIRVSLSGRRLVIMLWTNRKRLEPPSVLRPLSTLGDRAIESYLADIRLAAQVIETLNLEREDVPRLD